MATIHRIGEPENASELKAIKHLGKVLPKNYYIVHNFELVTGRGLPYEFDCCVVAPHAVYHVEVKGYRGAIRADGADSWRSNWFVSGPAKDIVLDTLYLRIG